MGHRRISHSEGEGDCHDNAFKANLGLESVTLRPCHDKALKDAIWIENARVVQEMEKLRLPDVPDVTPGLEKTTRKRVLFAYDETRNDEAWKKLKPPPGAEQAVLEVMLLGQFEAIEPQFPQKTQPKHSEFGTYRYQLILADVLSAKPAQLSAQTEQTRAAIHTTICEIVEETAAVCRREGSVSRQVFKRWH